MEDESDESLWEMEVDDCPQLNEDEEDKPKEAVPQSEDEKKVTTKRKREASPSESRCKRLCVENYSAVRDKVLQLTRRCLQRRKVQGSQLRNMLKERWRPVLKPSPAEDTLVHLDTSPLLLYGFGDPDAVTEQDVSRVMGKYGKVTFVQFVLKGGRRQPRCFVDFEDASSVKAAMKLSACCVQGQVLGFMEVTSSFLDAVTGRPKVRVTEDPLDDDLEVPLVKEFDITKEEKEEALLRAVPLVDTVCSAFLPEENSSFVEEIKLLASACP